MIYLHTSSPRRRAFSLLELLVTIAIILVLASLLLPVLQGAKAKALRTRCSNNLRQVGIAYLLWAHDHEDKFPMEVSTNSHGTAEFVQLGASMLALRHFQAISNELVEPKLLLCAVDNRPPAGNFHDLDNTNVSFGVNTRAAFGKTDSVLVADRNVRTSGRMESSYLQFGPGDQVEWSSALHAFRGNVLFADGHVEAVANQRATAEFTGGGDVLLVIPQDPTDSPVAVSPAPPNNDPITPASPPTPPTTTGPATPPPLTVSPGELPSPNPSVPPSFTAPTRGVSPPRLPVIDQSSTSAPITTIVTNITTNVTQLSVTAPSYIVPITPQTVPATPSGGDMNAVGNVPGAPANQDPNIVVAAAAQPPAPVAPQPAILPALPVSQPPITFTSSVPAQPASAVRAAPAPQHDDIQDWRIEYARWLGKAGARASYLLLFLLLAALVAVEVERRRRKKNLTRGGD